jgi:hypothetical protein
MTAQTRRAALGAVLAAGAVGAIPAVAAIASPTPDAEILALRAEFVRLNDAYGPLNKEAWDESEAFLAMVEETGWAEACTWAAATGCDGRNDATERMSEDLARLVERMLALGPTTLAGIAAVAATLREDALDHYWKEPIAKRDWDVELVTQFIDALVVAGPGRGA